MATAAEIATRALRRLGIVDSLHDPSAQDSAHAVQALEEIITSFEAGGLSGDTLPLHNRFQAGLVAMLAERLAEDYGMTPGAILVRDAEVGRKQIGAAFFAVPPSSFERSLTHNTMNSTLALITNTQDTYSAWVEGTDYELRQYVINGANLYECITAGTSAASGGPSGTDSDITDGTVHWCWRRVWGE